MVRPAGRVVRGWALRRWNEREDRLIRMFASEGAVRIAQEIAEQVGSDRSPHAIECRASRIGVSLLTLEQCPMCGRWQWKLRPSGLCPVCHQKELLERTIERGARLRSASEDTSAEEDAIKRERAVRRMQNSRMSK